MDRRPGARPQPAPGGHGAVPDERKGALPNDDGHVLPEGPARRQDALQGLQHQALHGYVQQRRSTVLEEGEVYSLKWIELRLGAALNFSRDLLVRFP